MMRILTQGTKDVKENKKDRVKKVQMIQRTDKNKNEAISTWIFKEDGLKQQL